MTIKANIVKSDCGRYWVDSFNNKWHREYVTEDDANKYALSVMGCRDCYNCYNLIDCIRCSGCRNCRNCTGLLNEYDKSDIRYRS